MGGLSQESCKLSSLDINTSGGAKSIIGCCSSYKCLVSHFVFGAVINATNFHFLQNELAILEQKKADERVLKLAEDQKYLVFKHAKQEFLRIMILVFFFLISCQAFSRLVEKISSGGFLKHTLFNIAYN
ncbi:hypothetical protein L6452_17245 [Arctium lappa]|uniref:Uncharacterized protein n=1 Tax=Arctium lappa TaxID=4217 RepID=A0ACB9C360_ARCLA|nr:hypothetical protein L6452_17245 [Arctium lappa]